MSNLSLSKNNSKKDSRQSTSKAPAPSIDLQERTLRVSNYGRKVTERILRELFSQGGPVKKIVFKEQFSFIEFEDADSVAYCLALFDGVELFGERLQLQPKINQPHVFSYLDTLKKYEEMFANNPSQWWTRFGDTSKPCPKHICAYSPGVLNYPSTNYDLYNGPIMNNHPHHQMMNNSMMNNQMMNNQMMYNQMMSNHQMMNNQMLPTSSSSYQFGDSDFRRGGDHSRSFRDFDGGRRSFNNNNNNNNQINRNRNNDRNNNVDKMFHRTPNAYDNSNKKQHQSSNNKRSNTTTSSMPHKKRKHQSF